jgi:DNA-binding MarR family transcriptional regulator
MKQDLPLRHELNLNMAVASALINSKFGSVSIKYGLTVSQYNLLRILMGVYPDGHPRCDIAERMIEKSSDITRIIDRLEKQGLVIRDRTEEDRRLSITRITNKGIKILKELEPAINSTHKEITKDLSDDECRKLSYLVEKLYGHMI